MTNVDRLTRVLNSRAIPFVCGLLTLLMVARWWDRKEFSPWVSDERAYLLQAEIFAAGKWKLPARPLPEFFEQQHTFVTPFVAAKYPPGHSLLLAAGVWVGWPPIVPLLLAGLSGGLMFAIGRRVSSGAVALLAWSLWIAMMPNFDFLSSYFSETTTLALWLLGWFALLRRHDDGNRAWTVVATACIGWMVITRPLTGVAYGIVTGSLLIYEEYRRRSMHPMMYGLLILAIIGAIVPVWSKQTLGSWTTTPYQYYSRLYTPFDKPGFALDSTRPLRALPADLANNYAGFYRVHEQHVIGNLPAIAGDRIVELVRGIWPRRYVVLVPALVVGLFSLPSIALAGPVSVVVLMGSYLSFAHPAQWLLYYLEIMPVIAFLAALGVGRIVRVFGRIAWKRAYPETVLAFIAIAVVVPFGARVAMSGDNVGDRVRQMIAAIPTPRNIVFVRYPPNTSLLFQEVTNGAFLEREHNVVVYDRGTSANVELLRLFPDRSAYMVIVEGRGAAVLQRLSGPETRK